MKPTEIGKVVVYPDGKGSKASFPVGGIERQYDAKGWDYRQGWQGKTSNAGPLTRRYFGHVSSMEIFQG